MQIKLPINLEQTRFRGFWDTIVQSGVAQPAQVHEGSVLFFILHVIPVVTERRGIPDEAAHAEKTKTARQNIEQGVRRKQKIDVLCYHSLRLGCQTHLSGSLVRLLQQSSQKYHTCGTQHHGHQVSLLLLGVRHRIVE